MADDTREESLEGVLRAAFQADPGDSVLDRIRKLGARARVLLPDAGDETSPVVRAPAPGRAPDVVDDERYQVLGEIGRGGVGVVYKGRDRDLGRDVALKVLRPEHTAVREVLDRFVEEAQIGAQLQHPGIVPVYGIGLQPDGRPFFTMRLVKGKTLSALLRERGEPGRERRRFLQVFEQTCQAVAYAHSRGVVHRDLKPPNVMVGAFGEVLVVDWGFGRLLATQDGPPTAKGDAKTVIVTVRSGAGGSDLASGSGDAAFAYMPPEQAAGLPTEMDRRSDVWSLGAILCEILTGRPPYVGEGSEVRALAIEARLTDAHERLARCGAEPELVDLAKRCLAPRRGDRPTDAGEVAQAIAAHLAAAEERAHAAEVRAVEERARLERERRDAAWAKVARRRTRLVAACVVLAAAAGTAAWLVDDSARNARLEKARPRVEAALEEAALLKAKGDYAQALARARKAHELAETSDAGADLHAHADATVAEIARVAEETEAARRRKESDAALVGALDELTMLRADEYDIVGADQRYLSFFAAHDLDLTTVAPAEVARRIRDRFAAIVEDIARVLDRWAWIRRTNPSLAGRDPGVLLEVAKQADPDPWRNALRDAMAAGDGARLQTLAAEALERGLSARALDLVGMGLSQNGTAESAAYYRRIQRLHPSDFWINLRAGGAKGASPQEAVAFTSAAVALRPASTLAHFNLGCGLAKAGRSAQALSEYRHALRLDPKNAGAQINIGALHLDAGRYDEAEVALRAALLLAPSVAVIHANLGLCLQRQSKDTEAIAACREALRLEPTGAGHHATLAYVLVGLDRIDEAIAQAREAIGLDANCVRGHVSLGAALSRKGLRDEAVAEYREAIRLDPNAAAWRRELGTILADGNLFEEAIEQSREAVRLAPEDAETRTSLAIVLGRAGHPEEGIKVCRQAIAMDPKSGAPHAVLGNALIRQGKWEEGAASMRSAIARFESLTWPDRRLALAYGDLAFALLSQGRPGEAIAPLRSALRMDAKYAQAHYQLGTALYQTGRAEEAIAELRDAIRLEPSDAKAHNNLGLALCQSSGGDEGMREFREAIRLAPKFAPAHMNLGIALLLGRRIDEAILELTEATRLDPSLVGAFVNLAVALQAKGRYEEALAAIDEAVRLRPDAAGLPGQRAPILIRLRRLDDAQRAIEASLAASDSPSGRFWDLSNAACIRALQADAPSLRGNALAPAERSRLRREALAHLREALLLAPAADAGRPVGQPNGLARWLEDPDLASVRDPAALAKLPAEERAAWEALWNDVRGAIPRPAEGK